MIKYLENEDYSFIDDEENESSNIKLLKDPFRDIIVEIIKVSFKAIPDNKEEVFLEFEYDIVNSNGREEKDLRNNVEFEQLLGNIAASIIEEYATKRPMDEFNRENNS